MAAVTWVPIDLKFSTHHWTFQFGTWIRTFAWCEKTNLTPSMIEWSLYFKFLTYVFVKRLVLGMGNGNGKVTSVPGDDSIISGANTYTTTHPPTLNFNHKGVLWEKSTTSNDVLIPFTNWAKKITSWTERTTLTWGSPTWSRRRSSSNHNIKNSKGRVKKK